MTLLTLRISCPEAHPRILSAAVLPGILTAQRVAQFSTAFAHGADKIRGLSPVHGSRLCDKEHSGFYQVAKWIQKSDVGSGPGPQCICQSVTLRRLPIRNVFGQFQRPFHSHLQVGGPTRAAIFAKAQRRSGQTQAPSHRAM